MTTFRIINADVLEGLRSLPDGSVRCCVTSPPYWGLRDYGTAEWEGGVEGCDHAAPSRFDYALNAGLGPTGTQDQASNAGSGSLRQFRDTCKRCGARRIDRQLGLEPTPEEYVAKMVDVFREVRRVLADDGTVWLNLGDSYASDTKGSGGPCVLPGAGRAMTEARYTNARRVQHGLKPKDLVGIPWRVAFALQSDGWWLRQDIVWSKPNPMPESVRDRCTKAHEYVFLLSKAARYYYDAEAVAEPVAREFWGETVGPEYMTAKDGRLDGGKRKGNGPMDGTRNRRSVWNIATQPFPGAHFAVMPEALAAPCVLAGSEIGDAVLDPFAGSGTVGVVALDCGREFIGIELNPEYAKMAEDRIRRRRSGAARTTSDEKEGQSPLFT